MMRRRAGFIIDLMHVRSEVFLEDGVSLMGSKTQKSADADQLSCMKGYRALHRSAKACIANIEISTLALI